MSGDRWELTPEDIDTLERQVRELTDRVGKLEAVLPDMEPLGRASMTESDYERGKREAREENSYAYILMDRLHDQLDAYSGPGKTRGGVIDYRLDKILEAVRAEAREQGREERDREWVALGELYARNVLTGGGAAGVTGILSDSELRTAGAEAVEDFIDRLKLPTTPDTSDRDDQLRAEGAESGQSGGCTCSDSDRENGDVCSHCFLRSEDGEPGALHPFPMRPMPSRTVLDEMNQRSTDAETLRLVREAWAEYEKPVGTNCEFIESLRSILNPEPKRSP